MNKKIFWVVILVIIFFAVFYVASLAFVNNEVTLEEKDFEQVGTINIASDLDTVEQAEILPDELNLVEFLPDLVPLPAQDLEIRKEDNNLKLLFSTIYYNQGTGPLELIADPESEGIREDIERDVLQRITRKDGSQYTKVVGNFLWHQEHLHYHFADFVDYILESVDTENSSGVYEVRVKSTFCIRDVSLIDLELENRAEKAEYLICGKEKQGISVGWADTYFFSYFDQNLDISNMDSGIYRLTFDVNPQWIIDELDYKNNKASILLDINIEELTVEIIKEEPENYPAVEHIYNEQVFD